MALYQPKAMRMMTNCHLYKKIRVSNMAYDKYRTYWEELKTEVISLLSSAETRNRELGINIKDLISEIEKKSKGELYGEFG